VREDGRIVGGERWKEKVHNREELKKLLRTARNHHILHMAMELILIQMFKYLPQLLCKILVLVQATGASSLPQHYNI